MKLLPTCIALLSFLSSYKSDSDKMSLVLSVKYPNDKYAIISHLQELNLDEYKIIDELTLLSSSNLKRKYHRALLADLIYRYIKVWNLNGALKTKLLI